MIFRSKIKTFEELYATTDRLMSLLKEYKETSKMYFKKSAKITTSFLEKAPSHIVVVEIGRLISLAKKEISLLEEIDIIQAHEESSKLILLIKDSIDCLEIERKDVIQDTKSRKDC